jgi:uncharacterized membrane protein YqgA involved in biofilm formation
MGIGVLFSAIPVLIYQGGIALASLAIRDFLTDEIIREMSAVGNLLVAGIGFNFLANLENSIEHETKFHAIKEIRVANLIPAIFIPWIYLGVVSLLR